MTSSFIGIPSSLQNYGQVDLRNTRRYYLTNERKKISIHNAHGTHVDCMYPKKHAESTEVFHFSVHTSLTSKMLFPSLIALYLNYHSPLPMLITLYSFLVLYLLEVCGFRDSLLVGNWISFWGMSMSLFYEYYRWNDGCVWGVLTCIFDVSLLGCLVSNLY